MASKSPERSTTTAARCIVIIAPYENISVSLREVRGRAIADAAIATAAETRLDPADLINAAVGALIRDRYELPRLSTLRTLAGTAHRLVNIAQWKQVNEQLTVDDRHRLAALLVRGEDTQESPFAVRCRGAGKRTRENLKALIAHYDWLRTLIDPTPLLARISEAKVAQWANEAQRLKARELREYVAPRRHALLLAILRETQGRLLDELTVMLLKFASRIEWKSAAKLEDWQASRRVQTDDLVRALARILAITASDIAAADKVRRLDATIADYGGHAHLQRACDEYLGHSAGGWQPFAREAFSPFRSELLLLARTLPLKAARPSADQLIQAVIEVSEDPDDADYYLLDLSHEFLPLRLRPLVADHQAHNPRAFNRAHLGVAVTLELAEAIKTGAIHDTGSLSYDNFWGRLPPETSGPARMTAYAAERGWPASAEGYTGRVRARLVTEAVRLDTDVGLLHRVRLDKNQRPIVPRVAGVIPPASAIKNVLNRYVITTFAYGCGLDPTQAARHFAGEVTAEELSFVDRRHMDTADLRAGFADLQALYAQFELTKPWGTGESAADDGTHFETFRDNPLAARHFRYRKTGGIAYRHVSDNYIASCSRFIGCGIYEATYILDILHNELSDLRPS